MHRYVVRTDVAVKSISGQFHSVLLCLYLTVLANENIKKTKK